MPCQFPPDNNIQATPRIRRWATQLEKHSHLFTVRALLYSTALFVVAGYALGSFLEGRATTPGLRSATALVYMGSTALIFITGYFLIIQRLFRNRPPEVQLVQRFIWYCAILLVVTAVMIGSVVIAA